MAQNDSCIEQYFITAGPIVVALQLLIFNRSLLKSQRQTVQQLPQVCVNSSEIYAITLIHSGRDTKRIWA